MELLDIESRVEREVSIAEPPEFFAGYMLSNPDDMSSGGRFKYPKLIKRGDHDHILSWQVGYDPITGTLYTEAGNIGMKMTVRPREIEANTHHNQTEAAIIFASDRFRRKQRAGYHEQNAELPDHLKFPKAMSAKTMAYGHKTSGNDVIPLRNFPVVSTLKLDGVRALVRHDESFGQQDLTWYVEDRQVRIDGIQIRSKKGLPFRFFDHIRSEVAILLTFLPRNTNLDGEFYSPNISHSVIRSACAVNSKHIHPWEKKIGLYVFDIIENQDLPFFSRYTLLFNSYREASKHHFFTSLFILQCTVHPDLESIQSRHLEVEALNMEGLVLRQLDPRISRYTPGKRSEGVLKIKSWETEDCVILSVSNTNKGTHKGLASFDIVDVKGVKHYNISIAADHGQRREFTSHPELAVGKNVTVRFQYREVNGGLFHPVITEIRDYED